ncbi:MAG: ribose 5-phosphate isomerase B [Saprospirales bacterium]|nr:MAG: ribose 5-phosphate isomerase B [Saprospirales bacterium]
MTVSIGNDHAGTDYKKLIVSAIKDQGVEVINHGTDSGESVDYPDFVHPVAKDVLDERAAFGIVICGSGNGVAMTVNKYRGIRAALCWNVELAKLARHHNNANILAIPARFVDSETAVQMVAAFLAEPFEGGRHSRRVDKISQCI